MTLPEGTVTFLRTDIEGSMELIRALGPGYDELNAEHAAIVQSAIEQHGGHVVRTEGDAFFAVFTDALAAARAAVDLQRELLQHAWPASHEVRARVGLHAGSAHRAGDDYGGLEVSRAARIAALGWGGQIIMSDTARALVASSLPEGWVIRDLGRHRLKGLAELEPLFQLDVEGLPTAFPVLRSSPSASDRLPDRLTALIGRDLELRTLSQLLSETRLLTLTGPGGVGKTSLALELARQHAGEFPDGAYLVDLQAVADEDQVVSEIAHGVGLLDGPTGPAAERLSAYLASRALLLVIDNFEQVIGAARVVADLLASSPGSRVIVTSRSPLRLRAEQEFAVQPLPVRPAHPGPDQGPDSDAVRLFIERARRVRPDLAVDGATVEVIAEICRLVDGLPLAIELCAARAATLPSGAILERLRAHQPLPGSGPRDLPDRQRTIERTVAWSHDLLEPSLQRLYRWLAVFEESVELDRAELVCGPAAELGADVLDGLVRLTENNLLARGGDASDGLRFGWLETIRSDALARLELSGEDQRLRALHARAYADLATEAGLHLPGAEQARWLDRLQADDANLRAATRHAIRTGDVETALRLVAGLWRYWLQSGRLAEGGELVAQALALPGADRPSSLRVRALDAAGGIAYWSGDVGRANGVYEEELALAQRIGDGAGEALAWLDLFFTREALGDLDGALSAKAASEALLRALGDSFGLARLEQSGFLILLARGADDPMRALAEIQARAAAAEELDDPWLNRIAPAMRGFACLATGEIGAGLDWLAQALRANLAVRERTDTALAMQFAVLATPLAGRPDVAAVIHGAVLAALEQLGIRAPASYAELAGSDPIPGVREALGVEAFDAAVEHGRRLSLEEAVDLIEEVAGASGAGERLSIRLSRPKGPAPRSRPAR